MQVEFKRAVDELSLSQLGIVQFGTRFECDRYEILHRISGVISQQEQPILW
jgi:hypothetical protein